MASPALITLLTDFGLKDGYVAAMRGVIASLAPDVSVVDISHEIEPQAVRRAGLVWAQAVRYFPRGSIHVAVVDPGVGSRRKIIAFSAGGSIYLAPDNGLIGYVFGRRQIRKAVEVRRRRLFLEPLSDTFHGRDIFAPVAAHLALGLALEELGPPARAFRLESLPRARCRRRAGILELRGEVVDVDRFGNAVTNLEPPPGGRFLEAQAGALKLRRLERSYAAVARGTPLLIVGSMGYLELAVREGSAAEGHGLRIGDKIVARWRVG